MLSSSISKQWRSLHIPFLRNEIQKIFKGIYPFGKNLEKGAIGIDK